jgi:hypothetical protein
MSPFRTALVMLLAMLIGYCSASAPAFADGEFCPRINTETYPPKVYLPEQAQPPLWMPDNRRVV